MGVDTHFTITKSVFSSGAANDDVVSNDVNCAAIFDSVTDSVIYEKHRAFFCGKHAPFYITYHK